MSRISGTYVFGHFQSVRKHRYRVQNYVAFFSQYQGLFRYHLFNPVEQPVDFYTLSIQLCSTQLNVFTQYLHAYTCHGQCTKAGSHHDVWQQSILFSVSSETTAPWELLPLHSIRILGKQQRNYFSFGFVSKRALKRMVCCNCRNVGDERLACPVLCPMFTCGHCSIDLA